MFGCRKKLFCCCEKREWTPECCQDIDRLGRDMGIMIPQEYLSQPTAENQVRVQKLLMEAERNYYFSRVWAFPIIAGTAMFLIALGVWYIALQL